MTDSRYEITLSCVCHAPIGWGTGPVVQVHKWSKVWVQEFPLLPPNTGIWSAWFSHLKYLRWLPSCFPALKFCDSDRLLFSYMHTHPYGVGVRGVLQLNIYFKKILSLLFKFLCYRSACRSSVKVFILIPWAPTFPKRPQTGAYKTALLLPPNCREAWMHPAWENWA